MAIKELLVEIKVKADNAKRQLREFAKTVKEGGDQSKSASKEVEKYDKTVQDAGKSAESTAREEKSLSNAERESGESAKTAATGVEKLDSGQKKAKDSTHKMTDAVKEMTAPLADVKGALGALNGILGMFGVSVGISALINQIKKLKEEAEKAHEMVSKLHQTMTYQYSLTEGQRDIVRRIASTDGGNLGYAGDVNDLTKIVGAVATLNKGASLDQIEKLSRTYAQFAEMGIGSLDSTVKSANQLFGQFGISIDEQSRKLEYLRSVSEKTLIPFDDLISLLKQGKPVADEYGLSIEQLASMIGKSAEINFGDTSAISGFFSEFERTYESALKSSAENISAKLSEYIDTFGTTFEQAVANAKSAIEKQLTEGMGSSDKSEFLATNADTIRAKAEIDAKTYMDTLAQKRKEIMSQLTEGMSPEEQKSFADSINEALKPIAETKAKVSVSGKFEGFDDEDKREFLESSTDIIEEKAKKDAKAYLDAYSAEFRALVDSGQYQLNPFETSDAIVYYNRTKKEREAAKKTSEDVNRYAKAHMDDLPQESREGLAWRVGNDPMLGGGTNINFKFKIDGLEDASKGMVALTEKGATPLNTAILKTETTLGSINTLSTQYRDTTYSSSIPAMQDEASAADNLAHSWNAAADAKERYNNA